MGYESWHDRPGYWREYARYFAGSPRVLDLGCGTAWVGELYPNYVGLDRSLRSLHLGARRGRLVQGDIEHGLPFATASFDAVLAKDVLEHLIDPVHLVLEIRRILRPGGTVVASSPDAQRWVWHDYTHRRPFTKQAYRRLFTDCGFEVQTLAYENVVRGVGPLSAALGHQRPRLVQALAHLPGVRRNVMIRASARSTER